jgi:small subunit ribosomal protein S2
VQEAQKLGIPIFAVVDTNCNPDDIDYPIPGNDDAIRAIALFLEVMAKAIVEGQSGGQSSDIAFEDEDGASAPVAEDAVDDAAEVKAAPKEKEAVREGEQADQW